jgi:transketolase
MPLVNAFSKVVVRDFSIEELEQAARLMRGYDLVALCAAGFGHAGSTLSIMDIVAALYLKVATHDPNNPEWPHRDRIVWSAGHKAPALYLGLAFAGYFPIEEVVTLRKLYSPFQGHPHRLKVPGVEVSSGSLGQGLSIAVGMALAGKLDHDEHTVFCIMGDGEQQEGSVWEAAMEASHYKLDNLVAIIDRNRLQIDGWVSDVMNVEPPEERYRSFGWEVVEVDGHDMPRVVAALQKAKSVPIVGRPTVILANTVSGKGVRFMEDFAAWTGKAPSYDEMVSGLDELGLRNVIAYDALLNLARHSELEVETKSAVKEAEPLGNSDPRLALIKEFEISGEPIAQKTRRLFVVRNGRGNKETTLALTHDRADS